MQFLINYLIGINAIAFTIYGLDKWFAKNNKHRISEFILLVLSLIGGSVGSLLAMFLFRHKISKWSFLWKFILVIGVQVGIFYLIYKKTSI